MIFWRTSQSGGRATFRKKKGKSTTASHCGDITAVDPIGKPLTDLITFELKKGYRTTTPFAMIDKLTRHKAPEFEEFVVQARTAAHAAGTPHWAIIHARTSRREMIYLDQTLFDGLADLGVKFERPGVLFLTWVGKEKVSFTGMPFDSFLSIVTPEHIKALL